AYRIGDGEGGDCARRKREVISGSEPWGSQQVAELWDRTRVRSQIFLCMLAYYVEWRMREAWRPLMFADVGQQAKATRDPVAVAKAKQSEAADQKAASPQLAAHDGAQLPDAAARS